VKRKREKLPHLHLLSEVLSVRNQRFSPILFLQLTIQKCNSLNINENFVKVKKMFINLMNSVFFSSSYLARELITDNELHRLANKYHYRHPTFTIDIQERTCKRIILACIYHYRHIELNLRCQCIYDDSLHKFESNWSTDNVEYRQILDGIFLSLKSSLINRSFDDQIESIIEQITKYFIRLKPIQEERQQQPIITTRKDSTLVSSPIEIVKYERSPLNRRKQYLERSLSCLQPSIRRSIRNKCNSMLVERKS
jgi:hypothetical protein